MGRGVNERCKSKRGPEGRAVMKVNRKQKRRDEAEADKWRKVKNRK